MRNQKKTMYCAKLNINIMFLLQQDKSTESLVSVKSGQAAIPETGKDTCTSLPELSATCKLEESGDTVDNLKVI